MISRARQIADLIACEDKIISSKYNKPFPVTLIPSAIGYYLGVKQGERQAQVLEQIRKLGEGKMEDVERIADAPR